MEYLNYRPTADRQRERQNGSLPDIGKRGLGAIGRTPLGLTQPDNLHTRRTMQITTFQPIASMLGVVR